MHGHCAQAALATFNMCWQMFKYIVYVFIVLCYCYAFHHSYLILNQISPVVIWYLGQIWGQRSSRTTIRFVVAMLTWDVFLYVPKPSITGFEKTRLSSCPEQVKIVGDK